jgi:hypothetical protein
MSAAENELHSSLLASRSSSETHISTMGGTTTLTSCFTSGPSELPCAPLVHLGGSVTRFRVATNPRREATELLRIPSC